MDILLLTGGSISHKILTQDATGGFTTELFDSDAQFSDADAADIDGDGDIDFVGATGTTVQPSIVWQNNGDASFTMAQSVLQNTGNGDVEIADLNGDGLLDLFFANDNAASVFFGQ